MECEPSRARSDGAPGYTTGLWIYAAMWLVCIDGDFDELWYACLRMVPTMDLTLT